MHPLLLPLALLLLPTMATFSPQVLNVITLNGEEYLPTPHEVNSSLPEDLVWSSFPYNSLFLSDPTWYDSQGQDQITQRRIWGVPSDSGQVDQFRQLLREKPERSLDMMFAAAAKGRAHVVRFLLEQGVKPSAVEADGDDMTLVPLHAAAYQGRFDCVKILMEEGKLDPNTKDDMGGTALMRACWGKHPEIVEYLLAAGADMKIRQTASADVDASGANAFEFAGGSGGLECAKVLVKHAEGLGISSKEMFTPLALAAAAQSDDIETLQYYLHLGGYYEAETDGLSATKPTTLTSPMKDAIESALLEALNRGRYTVLPTLFTFLSSTTISSNHQFPNLKAPTIDALVESLWQLAAHNSEFHIQTFALISDDILVPTSRFITPAILDQRSTVLNDAYFRAAQNGCLEMMKFIESRHPALDVNHLTSWSSPKYTSALSAAAESGRMEIVAHILDTHGEQLNVQLAGREFADGPSVMWHAVVNGHQDIARLLLERVGGPVDIIGKGIEPVENQKSRVVLTAARDIACYVGLATEAASVAMYGDLGDETSAGTVKDENGGEGQYVLLEFEEGDRTWWDKLQLRMSDEELLAMETHGRPLREKAVPV
jgi:hypothetical protein